MKQWKLSPLLFLACLLLASAAVAGLVRQAIPYNPERYITLGDYEHLSVSVEIESPTEEGADRALQTVLARLADEKEVTDGAKMGDAVNINYTGRVDGEISRWFTSEDVTLTLGENAFVLAGMDEPLLGVKPGDERTVTLTVGEDYYREEYHGKQVVFTVQVNRVTRAEVPELTDEVAAKLGDYDSAEEYRAAFRQEYNRQKEAENRAAIRSALWSAAVDAAEVLSYPTAELTALKEDFRREVQAGADEYEMSFDDYLAFGYGIGDNEAYEAYADRYCQSILKQQMVLRAISRREGVTLSVNDYDHLLKEYLAAQNDQTITEADLQQQYGGAEGLREQFLMELVTDRLQQTATVHTTDLSDSAES